MNGMIKLMEFIIRDANRWTTFAAIVESKILNWPLDNRHVSVLVSIPNIDLKRIDQLKQMASSMRDDILFLDANADDNETDSINGQIQTLNDWIGLLSRYQAWK
ncbi:hypothetical protein ACYATM_06365 [Lactobacillaceae bacterium Scapto_B20]